MTHPPEAPSAPPPQGDAAGGPAEPDPRRPLASARVVEPAQQTEVFGEFDVCVLGGGPAGLAAAVSAARGGARTLLVERYGFLGGMGTAGGVTNFAGLYGRRDGQVQQLVHGVVDELLARIDRLGGLNDPQDGLQGRIRVRSYDVSAYKCAADDWLLAAGVQLLFHALAVGRLMDGSDPTRIDALLVETKSGRRAIRAREFIDASGDADLAHWAGVPYELGDGAGSALFPSTMFRVGNVDAERARAAIGEFRAIDALMERAADRYRFPRRGAILRPQRNPREWRANVTQLANDRGQAADATDAVQLSAAEVEGRRQIVEYMRFLHAEVPGFEAAEISDIAAQVGIRESRRITLLALQRACQLGCSVSTAAPAGSGPCSRGKTAVHHRQRLQHPQRVPAWGATWNRPCAGGHHRRPARLLVVRWQHTTQVLRDRGGAPPARMPLLVPRGRRCPVGATCGSPRTAARWAARRRRASCSDLPQHV
jgi:hypothetical protein